MLHQELGREQMVQIRTEVEHNRLEARLGEAGGSEKGVSRWGMAARSVAALMPLLR